MIVILILTGVTIAGVFITYSCIAAAKLKNSGTLLRDGDTKAAGDMLNRAGMMYMNIIIGSVALAFVLALISIELASRS